MPRRLIALALLTALVSAACGGDGGGTGIASLDDGASVAALEDDGGTAAGMDSEEAMLALAECLREQGLDVEDPGMAEDGMFRPGQMFRPADESAFDRAEFRDAMEACSEYRDAIVTQFDGVDRADMEDQIYEYAACMRENGYEMPDPDFGIDRERGQGEGDGEGFGGGPFASIDPTDPAFVAANEVCQDLFGGGILPGAGGGPGGGPGGAPPPGEG
ncbi:MAG: hypothetical protein KQH83_06610 [Actinobacteria bacterium]|nr:hypothetical protein [Actinomycetota bacterium]